MSLLRPPPAREVIVHRKMNFCLGHRLFEDGGACRNIHGHNIELLVEVLGRPRADGMVLSFADLKAIMMRRVHDVFDHMTVLRYDDPFLEHQVNKPLLGNAGWEHLLAAMTAGINATGYYDSRTQSHSPFLHGFAAIAIAEHPTSENMAYLIHRLLSPQLYAAGAQHCRVSFQETPNCGAIFGGATREIADYPRIAAHSAA